MLKDGPFGHGPRIAEPEIQLEIVKLRQNFKIELASKTPKDEIKLISKMKNESDKPLQLKFINLWLHKMGRPYHYLVVLMPEEKLLVLIFDVQFFSLQNETTFIPDQYCHLAEDGSPFEPSLFFSSLAL